MAARPTQVRAVLVASYAASEGTAVCPALMPLAGRCCLEYWLDAIGKCPRLQPLSEKLVVVCHPAHQQQLSAWASLAELPSSCIIPSSDSLSSLGIVQGVAASIHGNHSTSGCYVLVADASFVLEPGNSLNHLVEAAVVRGKDTITSIVPLEGADLSHLVLVHKEDEAADNCRITSIAAATEGAADGCCDRVLGPVCVLSPATVLNIQEAADQGLGPALGSIKELGVLFEHQLYQGGAIYNTDLPFYFSVGSQEDYVITDAFFRHYTALQKTAIREVQQLAVGVDGAVAAHITGTFDELMDKLSSLGTGHPPTPAHQQLVATMNTSRSASPSTNLTRTGGPGTNTGAAAGTLTLSSSTAGSASPGRRANTLTLSSSGGKAGTGKAGGDTLKRLFVDYYNKHQETLAREAKEAVQRDYGALPTRFAKPGGWDLHPKQQHACYTTSNNAYGAKRPTDFDMPLVWAGIHGKFTDTFHGGCYRHMGLKTSVERSRVHRGLDNL